MSKLSNLMKKPWLWAAAVVLAAAVLVLAPKDVPGAQPTPPAVTAAPTHPLNIQEDDNIDLGRGLVIERIDGYSGIYMEDGSNETVQNVMMVLLRNDSDQDLQLARIEVDLGDTAARFEATNLPAGARAVVLEQTRMTDPGADAYTAQAVNVVFFPEPMSLQPERLELDGEPGSLCVTNVSQEEIAAPVYVYYKNSAEDLYYGGITYRVTISRPIGAGETVTVPVGHYDPRNCRFVLVQCGA